MVSPDLSKLTLPQDVDVQLPNDLDLSNLDLTLPEDFDLQLPEGSTITPTGVDLPQGGSITLPDGRTFEFPAGSHLDLPPALLERLRQQGYGAGTLSSDANIPIRNLPTGTTARLDPPQFSGGGTLRLPAGSTFTLPDGQRFPFPAGLLAAAASYLLPAGTTIDIPFDADGSAGGMYPVPQPYSSSQLAGRTNVTASGTTRPGIAVDTEITDMPSRVRKGEPVVVGGYVRERATGRPVVGAPVDVFLNETKRTAGQLVGTGVSDAQGRFRIELDIPEDKPAANYQLVNHAAAFLDASGRAYADGWGDPPLATYATTKLTLEVPARDGLGSRTPLSGTLLDHTGAPVAGALVALTVDGVSIGSASTTATGSYLLTHVFAAGMHRVEARFAGTSNYDASNVVRANITIVDATLDIAPTVRTRPGDTLVLSGRLLSSGAGVPSRTVVIQGLPFGASTLEPVTDSAGRFSLSLSVPTGQRLGTSMLTYTVDALEVAKTQRLEVNETARMSLAAPSTWDVDVPFRANVTLVANGSDRPIADQPVRLVLSGPGGSRDVVATTDARGLASVELTPLRNASGTYVLSARAIGTPNLQVASVSSTLTLGVFQVAWDLPSSVTRGDPASLGGTVRFAGRPFAGQLLEFEAMGEDGGLLTDPEGRFSWVGRVPSETPVGPSPLRISAAGHPARFANVTVASAATLDLDAPRAFPVGDLEMALTLRDDQDAPIPEALVTLTAIGPGGVERTVVRTDARGRWSGPVNVTAAEGENVTLSARFDGQGPYLAADETEVLSATAPVVRGPPSPLLWIVPLAVLGVGGAAGGAWWYLRRRGVRAVPVVAATPAAAPVLRGSDLEVRFGIPADEPAVWGVGDPLELRVVNHGEAGDVEVAWGEERRRVAVAAEGEARLVVSFAAEGEVEVRALRPGASDTRPALATLRIVDYPKETAREFDLFLDKARNLDARIGRRSTPREIQWTLAEHLGGDAERQLEEVALVLEVTNYSNRRATRADYLRFVRASRALDPFFAPRASVPRG